MTNTDTLMALKVGEEAVVNGELWWRIDHKEFKVSPHGENDPDTDCYWVYRNREDISYHTEG
jgi:hypothetical protein